MHLEDGEGLLYAAGGDRWGLMVIKLCLSATLLVDFRHLPAWSLSPLHRCTPLHGSRGGHGMG